MPCRYTVYKQIDTTHNRSRNTVNLSYYYYQQLPLQISNGSLGDYYRLHYLRGSFSFFIKSMVRTTQ